MTTKKKQLAKKEDLPKVSRLPFIFHVRMTTVFFVIFASVKNAVVCATLKSSIRSYYRIDNVRVTRQKITSNTQRTKLYFQQEQISLCDCQLSTIKPERLFCRLLLYRYSHKFFYFSIALNGNNRNGL